MKTICFYFQVHQPFRLRRYRFFDIGARHNYFDDYANRTIMRKVADKCYLPTNQLFLDLIKEYGCKFKISYSISGTAIDQFEIYAPDVLDSFKRLAETGCVEFLAETYSHSLSSLKSREEFENQVALHGAKIKQHFNQTPTVFRNTELIYSDKIGEMVSEMGYKAILCEGAKHILGWKSPNYVYTNAINPKLKLLLKNFKLSDDIAFRFSNRAWDEWPLTTEKYVNWLNSIDSKEEIINLFMDYETFGEHQWEETGIFEFMRHLPRRVFSNSDFEFLTPSEAAEKHQPIAPMHVQHPISWADEERDLTAWLGNDLQDDAFDKLYAIREKIKLVNDENLIRDWKYLQTSDHFYYMCTKWFSDGDVHKYFNPYDTPYDAFINFMNILSDFMLRIDEEITRNDLKTLLPIEIKKMIIEYEQKIAELKNITESKTINKKIKPKAIKKKVLAKSTEKSKMVKIEKSGKTKSVKSKIADKNKQKKSINHKNLK
ncbi:MAG: alpha-amylase [Bacteroidetes bacterium GWC2_33_15]|nr:MAG: alpha-amylase [Bacteroidetes bacterium GWA2_33_15]OFX51166.1 MAG: alpha-amylase [Bacteroidetes bacterium GWC2_33_15]OFX66401.1 MAG: alpha-amylase [Bacteroidetes bacterium GWB2_32_14]OFX70374.1 MAG: alpha-amylase [Bacteroidetes bacterium GWD2_33_33]HAN17380.1 alpha-amylase [Bacteroidales bacterium]